MKKFGTLCLVFLLLVGCAACGGAKESGTYPEKAITLVIPYGTGGTTDLTGRQLALALEKELGVSVTVVNKAGASGAVGTEYVLEQEADGYTLLLSADSLGTQRVMGLSDKCYGDFTCVSLVTNDPKVIVVAKDSPYQTAEDLFGAMKENPGKIKMSYTGPGGSGHVQSLIYNAMGYEMALTAYGSGGDCILSVIKGETDFTNSNYSTVRSYLEAGTLRIVAVSEMERLSCEPDVPALREVFPGTQKYFQVAFTPLSLQAPKDTPSAVIEALQNACAAAFEQEEWKAYVNDNALEPLYSRYVTTDEQRQFFSFWESYVSWLLYDAGAAQISPEAFSIARPQGM